MRTDELKPDDTPEPNVTRRRLLHAIGGVSIAALAGCSTKAETEAGSRRPNPVSLGGGRQCDACGMVIGEHPGPNAMAFYRDHSPEGRDNPAWFDNVSEMVAYDAEKRRVGWERIVAYVTDYSTVEYTITTEQGTKQISGHVEPESFVEATEASYVVGSEVTGAMGADFLPFTDDEEAGAFTDDHGGSVVAFADLPAAPQRG